MAKQRLPFSIVAAVVVLLASGVTIISLTSRSSKGDRDVTIVPPAVEPSTTPANSVLTTNPAVRPTGDGTVIVPQRHSVATPAPAASAADQAAQLAFAPDGRLCVARAGGVVELIDL